jgi:hypothetical protein
MARLRKRIGLIFDLPLLSRLLFHVRRMTGGLERGFFVRLFLALSGFVVAAAVLLTAFEGPQATRPGWPRSSATASTGA